MEIRRGHLYVIDFNPRVRTKPGKLRPAVVLQSDILSEAGYPSTIGTFVSVRLSSRPKPSWLKSSHHEVHEAPEVWIIRRAKKPKTAKELILRTWRPLRSLREIRSFGWFNPPSLS